MRRFFLLLAAIAAASPVQAQTSDAEAQYRVARRLAAEGASGAAAAFDRVVELDPMGPLADDALLDRAALIGLPRWPEQRGGIPAVDVARARGLLDRVLDLPAADRAAEAAYRQGLLLLEPGAHYNAEEARLLLLGLAAGDSRTEWSSSARYVLAWSAEKRGDLEAAEAAYQRLRIDAPGTAVAARASAAIGRLNLCRGDFATAAARFSEAIESDALDDAGAERARASERVAVAAFLRRVDTAEALRLATSTRPSSLAARGTAGALIAQRKSGVVVELDPTGAVIDRWTIAQALSTATTRDGLRYAITAQQVFRLGSGGQATAVAEPGEFGSFSGGTADDLGRLWVLDRRGERVGLIGPGSTTPQTLWRGEGVRLASPVWDGNRVLALDTRRRTVVAIYPDGSSQTVVPVELDRPTSLGVDPAGRLGVLESRGTLVRFFGADGSALGKFSTAGAGMQRASALSFGLDGTMQLIEETSGLWWRAK